MAGNVDTLMDEANQEMDDAKRLALLKEIQMQILQQVPVMPLPSPAAIVGAQSAVGWRSAFR